jgi:hypothetical protein
MTPLERIELEHKYFDSCARRSGFDVRLHVFSSGLSFSIADPSSGAEWYRTAPALPNSPFHFCKMLDDALATARLCAELGIRA